MAIQSVLRSAAPIKDKITISPELDATTTTFDSSTLRRTTNVRRTINAIAAYLIIILDADCMCKAIYCDEQEEEIIEKKEEEKSISRKVVV